VAGVADAKIADQENLTPKRLKRRSVYDRQCWSSSLIPFEVPNCL
jgi:hypothetical protein